MFLYTFDQRKQSESCNVWSSALTYITVDNIGIQGLSNDCHKNNYITVDNIGIQGLSNDCHKNNLQTTTFINTAAVGLFKHRYVWQLHLQLPVHSVSITTNLVCSNPAQKRCTRYNIM